MGFVGDFLFGEEGQKPDAFRDPQYMQQSGLLNSLIQGQAVGANPALQNQFQNVNPITPNFQTPTLNFDQRSPFQFTNTFDPSSALTAVQDAFTPQAKAVESFYNRRGSQQDQTILDDMNRRGLLTAGATTEALGNRRESTDFALNQALSSLAGQQAQAGTQAQLQANALQAQLEQQRQINQAQELFRQQGATDAQAQQLANLSLQNRAFQATQNQLPIENLLRLYNFSTGATPGYEGSPGLIGTAAAGFGSGLGRLVGGEIF